MNRLILPHLYRSVIFRFYSDTETARELDVQVRYLNGLKESSIRMCRMYPNGTFERELWEAARAEYREIWGAAASFINNSPLIDEVKVIANDIGQFVLEYLERESVQSTRYRVDVFTVDIITDEQLGSLAAVLDEKFGVKIIRDD